MEDKDKVQKDEEECEDKGETKTKSKGLEDKDKVQKDEGGESTLPPPQVPRVPRDFCETTLISFLGQRYKIILQSKNGPWSLIAICEILFVVYTIPADKLSHVA